MLLVKDVEVNTVWKQKGGIAVAREIWMSGAARRLAAKVASTCWLQAGNLFGQVEVTYVQ